MRNEITPAINFVIGQMFYNLIFNVTLRRITMVAQMTNQWTDLLVFFNLIWSIGQQQLICFQNELLVILFSLETTHMRLKIFQLYLCEYNLRCHYNSPL